MVARDERKPVPLPSDSVGVIDLEAPMLAREGRNWLSRRVGPCKCAVSRGPEWRWKCSPMGPG